MTDEVKRIDIKEFRELGFLQEANRQFFHPLGLALEVEVDEEGNESLSGVWDYRSDPEGILYGDDQIDLVKVGYVAGERMSHAEARKKILGGEVIQT